MAVYLPAGRKSSPDALITQVYSIEQSVNQSINQIHKIDRQDTHTQLEGKQAWRSEQCAIVQANT